MVKSIFRPSQGVFLSYLSSFSGLTSYANYKDIVVVSNMNLKEETFVELTDTKLYTICWSV